jgi:hypothetical protein
MLTTKLFERPSNDFEYLGYKLRINSTFSAHNLLNISHRKFKKMFEPKFEKHYLRYRFELLKH